MNTSGQYLCNFYEYLMSVAIGWVSILVTCTVTSMRWIRPVQDIPANQKCFESKWMLTPSPPFVAERTPSLLSYCTDDSPYFHLLLECTKSKYSCEFSCFTCALHTQFTIIDFLKKHNCMRGTHTCSQTAINPPHTCSPTCTRNDFSRGMFRLCFLRKSSWRHAAALTHAY